MRWKLGFVVDSLKIVVQLAVDSLRIYGQIVDVSSVQYLQISRICCRLWISFTTNKSTQVHCSLDISKCSFYQSFIGSFGRPGRIVSNEVIVQLVKSKCFPVLF